MTSAKEIGSTFTVDDSKFETGVAHRFQCARDGDLLSIYAARMVDGNRVHVWSATGDPVQNFKAELDDEEDMPRGHFLVPQGPSQLKIVLTLKPRHQNSKVVLEEYKGKLEQLWFLIPVASTGNFSIINAYNGKALCNQGREENCRCIEVDPDDVNQQWKYI